MCCASSSKSRTRRIGNGGLRAAVFVYGLSPGKDRISPGRFKALLTLTIHCRGLRAFKRVNSALDNPINYFTAQNLSGRANDLNSLLDSMSTAINTIQSANNGITAITKLVQSAQSIVTQAQQTTDTNIRATLASQFDAIRGQIDQLAQDSGINGINLLNGDTLTVTMNETGTSTVAVSGVTDLSNGALAINGSTNNWAANTDITSASTQLTAALTTLRSQSQSLSSNLQTVQVRQDFTKAMINTLQTGADNLTLADSNE